MNPRQLPRTVIVAVIALALGTVLSACSMARRQQSQDLQPPGQDAQDWQQEFNIANRKLTDSGESKYFILVPGFETVLESQGEKVTITVLNETKEIGSISTRVIEEREEKGGQLSEVSRNFFAMDQDTGDVFYFGEEVDIYRDGKIVDHGGAWIAFENGNQPGLIMPGTPRTGMKYYQEVAPGVAMDRAEVLTLSETFKTPAGMFENCLVTDESSPLEPGVRDRKAYAPGIGLIQDESLRLVSYGYGATAGLPGNSLAGPVPTSK